MASRSEIPPPPHAGESPENCRRCELWEHSTQAVPGEGATKASIMLVGEQPGDSEDREGHPFVGPAGRLLDQLLEREAISRAAVFVTNAVKHFSWELRGKRRLHKRPQLRHIKACNIWLAAEIATHKPRVIVALGATALRALSGAASSIAALRGKPFKHASGAAVVATYHPSAILRADEPGASEFKRAILEDLKLARQLAGPVE
jgi:uracil-DNA glycosylase family protein